MNPTTKRIVLWTAIILGLVAFLWLLTKLGTAPASQGNKTLNEQIDSTQEHVSGNPNAPITIVEYSDFECPYCANVYPFFKQIVAEYPDDVRFVYRHFPLRAIHDHAQLAAQASEAAALQGKFWDMHDAIFNTQAQWVKEQDPEAFFIRLAVSLSLDEAQFTKDLTSKEVMAKVNEDAASAAALRLSGTPTTFINGTQYQISSYDQLKQRIDAEKAAQ